MPGHSAGISSRGTTKNTVTQVLGWLHRNSSITASPKILSNIVERVLLSAFEAKPNRFKGKMPQPPALPMAVWINKPKSEDGRV